MGKHKIEQIVYSPSGGSTVSVWWEGSDSQSDYFNMISSVSQKQALEWIKKDGLAEGAYVYLAQSRPDEAMRRKALAFAKKVGLPLQVQGEAKTKAAGSGSGPASKSTALAVRPSRVLGPEEVEAEIVDDDQVPPVLRFPVERARKSAFHGSDRSSRSAHDDISIEGSPQVEGNDYSQIKAILGDPGLALTMPPIFSRVPRWAIWGGLAGLGYLIFKAVSGPSFNVSSLLPVIGFGRLSEAFKVKVIQIGNDLGVDPNHLLAIMSFESKLDHTIRNAHGFTGLIQFGPPAAKDLGTTTDALRAMTAEQQLDYVKAYFEKRIKERGPIKTFADLYMAVLWPAAIGKGDGFVLFRSPSDAYTSNAALDRGKKGYVTVADAASFPGAILANAVKLKASQGVSA